MDDTGNRFGVCIRESYSYKYLGVFSGDPECSGRSGNFFCDRDRTNRRYFLWFQVFKYFMWNLVFPRLSHNLVVTRVIHPQGPGPKENESTITL